MANFSIWNTFNSVYSSFKSARNISGPSAAVGSNADGDIDNAPSSNVVQFTVSGQGFNQVYGMTAFTMNNGGTAVWFGGSGGGRVVPTNGIAYDTLNNNLPFTIVSESSVSRVTYASIATAGANQPPDVNASSGSASFLENGGAVTVDNGLTITDLEGDSIDGATVQITSGRDSNDVLAVTVAHGITASYNSGNGTLTLSGTTTVANYQSVLRTLTFNNANDDPGGTSRTLTYTVSDDAAVSDGSDTRGITLTLDNDIPTIANVNGDSATFTEGGGAVSLDSGTAAAVADIDSDNFSGGNLTVGYSSGQQADDRFVIDTSSPNVALSAGMTVGSTVSIGGVAIGTIAAGNTGGASENLVITFNSSATPARVQALINAIQYDNGGGDNPTAGARSVTFAVNDGDGGTSATSTVSLQVNGVNDPITATALPTSVSFLEDIAGNLDLSAATFVDADTTGAVSVKLTVSNGILTAANSAGLTITGSNSAIVTISGSISAIDSYLNTASNVTYKAPSEQSGSPQATLTITGNDGGGEVAIGTVNLNVTAQNDVPTVADLDGDSASYTEGDSAVSLDTGTAATVGDIDSTDFNGGNLTVANPSNAASGDLLSFDGTVTLGGQTAGSSVTVGGTLVGTLGNNISAGNDLVVNFNANATHVRVQALLNAITYNNTAGDGVASGNRAFTATVNDGDGGTSANQSLNVSVSGIDDAPTLTATGSNPTFIEDGANASLFSGSVASTVDPGQTISGMTLTVSNLADGADEILNIDGTDVVLTDTTSGTTATNSLSYSVSVTGSTATITFSGGTLSTSALQTLVNAAAYKNTNQDPSTASNRVVTITELVDSGSSAGTNENTTTLAIASSVAITPQNDAPVLGSVNGETSSIGVGGLHSNIDLFDNATLGNEAGAGYTGQTLAISSATGNSFSFGMGGTAFANGAAVVVGGITIGTVSAQDGQAGNALGITLNANATTALLQTFLRDLTAANTVIENVNFDITIQDADGTANSGTDSVTQSFTLDSDNSAPSFNDGTTTSINIDQGSGPVSINDLLDVADSNGGQTLTWSIITGPMKGALAGFNAMAGTTGTSVTPGGLTYDPTGLTTGPDMFQVQVSDGFTTDTITVNVTIDAGPTVTSFARQNPTNEVTNADSVTFRVTFSEDVTGVDTSDFTLAGSTATATSVAMINASTYDVTYSGGDLAALEGSVTANLVDDDSIQGVATSTPLAGVGAGNGDASSSNQYTLDNTAPTLSAVDLTDGSDLGPSNTDNETTDSTPTVEFTAQAGVRVEIDFDDGRGFLKAPTGTGAAQQVTLDPAYVTGGTKTIRVRATDEAGNATVTSLDIDISAIPIFGTRRDDVIDGTNGFDIINGLGGNDRIDGGNSGDKLRGNDGDDTLIGGNGADSIKGGDNEDSITGDSGNDLLKGGDGNDFLSGGLGRDTVYGGDDQDTLTGGEGNDVLRGGDGDDTLSGGDNSDALFGGGDKDLLSGGDGDDTLNGGEDNDTLLGQAGKDVLFGNAGDDSLNGGKDDDNLRGGDGDDSMTGGSGNDKLFGSDGDDQADGGTGHDTMKGGEGKDTLLGGAGNDLLQGGDGDDRLDGGGGNDTMVGDHGQDQFIFNDGHDSIVRFENNRDTIRLDANALGITGMSKADVLALASVVSGDIVFDFGGGNTLEISNYTNIASLQDDLVIV